MTTSSLPGVLREVGPDEKCDRCRHASRYHRNLLRDQSCRISSGPAKAGEKTYSCICDRFEAKPREAR